MPTFNFACDTCGREETTLVSNTESSVECIGCGEQMKRQFTPGAVLRLAPWLRAENENSRSRHLSHIESPEFQAKIAAGEVEPDSSDPYCDNEDGDHASSSITSRLENDIPVGRTDQ